MDSILDVLQLRDVQQVLRPSGLLFHCDQIINGGNEECAVAQRDLRRPLSKTFKLMALTDEQIHFNAPIRSAKVQCQHPFFVLPPLDLFHIQDLVQRFRNTRPGT